MRGKGGIGNFLAIARMKTKWKSWKFAFVWITKRGSIFLVLQASDVLFLSYYFGLWSRNSIKDTFGGGDTLDTSGGRRERDTNGGRKGRDISGGRRGRDTFRVSHLVTFFFPCENGFGNCVRFFGFQHFVCVAFQFLFALPHFLPIFINYFPYFFSW